MYTFPHETAFLPRTKLSYVNLPGILSDGKRDRGGRVSGFISVQLGDRCYLIFLRDGDAFQAAYLDPHGRGRIALAEVLRIASTECERGENGQLGFFGAPEAQLQAMLATLLNAPVPLGVEPSKPHLLFPSLRDRRFTGVVELGGDRGMQYLVFEDGSYRTGYFSTDRADVSPSEILRTIFSEARPSLGVALYPPMEALPVQASPGLVDLYRRIVGGTVRELAAPLGTPGGLDLMRRAQESAGHREPVVRDFVLTEEGRVRGDPVAEPAELTQAVALWITEALIAAADQYGVDPSDVLVRVARDSRFVLAEQGFFQRLPWALPF